MSLTPEDYLATKARYCELIEKYDATIDEANRKKSLVVECVSRLMPIPSRQWKEGPDLMEWDRGNQTFVIGYNRVWYWSVVGPQPTRNASATLTECVRLAWQFLNPGWDGTR